MLANVNFEMTNVSMGGDISRGGDRCAEPGAH